ncbi:MAG: hypothetical protein HY644_05140 [Acidobacteria bacterium]|nr:hypothetical protein [Acidobacteriota bacterium]
MQYRIEVLSHSLQGAIGVLLVLFAAGALYVLLRHREERAALLDRISREYFLQYKERVPRAVSAAISRRPVLPAVYRALWVSLGASLIAFLALAFTPLSYFPNFYDVGRDTTTSLELKTLHADFQGNSMRVDGEVTNISTNILPELHIHLILYDKDLAPMKVHTIDFGKPLIPGQTMPFFFSEPRLETVKQVGITFSSRFRPLLHKEGPQVKQPS